jgi:N-acetylglucosamine-6-phosphate deacetylase
MLKNNVLIFAENVVLPKGEVREGPFYVVVKSGIITKISKAESTLSTVAQCDRCDAVACHLLAPGFVDIHNHGLGKCRMLAGMSVWVVFYNYLMWFMPVYLVFLQVAKKICS